jgi:hypothetical protein
MKELVACVEPAEPACIVLLSGSAELCTGMLQDGSISRQVWMKPRALLLSLSVWEAGESGNAVVCTLPGFPKS